MSNFNLTNLTLDWTTNISNISNARNWKELEELRTELDKYITILLFIVGVPGNILSLIIWLQKRMRHSSGYYLAALALGDLIFLGLLLIYELHAIWMIPILDVHGLCESFIVLYMSLQFLSPFLVLAFTCERYISICHPFQREKYCTIKRAKIVIGCLVALIFLLNIVHAYMWHINSEGSCDIRSELKAGGSASVFIIYSTSNDMLAFLIVPGTIMVLNVLVIREMRRLSTVEHVQLQGSSQKTGSTTVMLLAVSFYQIITTLPISVIYALYFEYVCENQICPDPELDRRQSIYFFVQIMIKEYGVSHYAFNIFIYISTGKMFRQELKKLILLPFLKLAPNWTKSYTSLRTGNRGSEHSSMWVSVNGHNNRTTDETLL